MTDLRKQVRRRTISSAYSGRRLVVLLMPGDVLGIREERTRRVYTAPLGKLYNTIVRWTVEAGRAERLAQRRAARAGKKGTK